MLRLFTGIGIPDPVREQLAGLQGGLPGARWIEPHNFHITLVFMGEVREDVAEEVHDLFADVRVPSFQVKLSGIGSFEHGLQPTSVWVGVEPSNELQKTVKNVLLRQGVSVERRKYRPHITLARMRDTPAHRVASFITDHNRFSADFDVDSFTLFRSRISHNGAQYEALSEYPHND